jgi:hypothetical protein
VERGGYVCEKRFGSLNRGAGRGKCRRTGKGRGAVNGRSRDPDMA